MKLQIVVSWRFLFIGKDYKKGCDFVKKLEIITRPEKLEDIKELMNKQGIYGMTASMVSGCGMQKGRKEVYRGTEITINLLPKVKIETVVKAELVEGLVGKIVEIVKTGEVGDGKIFIYSVEEVVKIRTGEKGRSAL